MIISLLGQCFAISLFSLFHYFVIWPNTVSLGNRTPLNMFGIDVNFHLLVSCQVHFRDVLFQKNFLSTNSQLKAHCGGADWVNKTIKRIELGKPQ